MFSLEFSTILFLSRFWPTVDKKNHNAAASCFKKSTQCLKTEWFWLTQRFEVQNKQESFSNRCVKVYKSRAYLKLQKNGHCSLLWYGFTMLVTTLVDVAGKTSMNLNISKNFQFFHNSDKNLHLWTLSDAGRFRKRFSSIIQRFHVTCLTLLEAAIFIYKILNARFPRAFLINLCNESFVLIQLIHERSIVIPEKFTCNISQPFGNDPGTRKKIIAFEGSR